MVNGQGLGNQAAHPHEKFRGVPPGARRRPERSLSYQKQRTVEVLTDFIARKCAVLRLAPLTSQINNLFRWNLKEWHDF